ncbi:hypothetical protein [Nocardiopsis sp. LOL_012]|uniref:hypothetical protein n=1 Tax=Nocardiopsis sp. LOL_012 TaxID=3345409 RepID=UPI003A87A724
MAGRATERAHARRLREERDAARTLAVRYRQRWDEALDDGERFKEERDRARAELRTRSMQCHPAGRCSR